MESAWLDYVNVCYDLVTESAIKTHVVLEHNIEAYIVHLMARNINRTDIGSQAIAIKLLTATHHKDSKEYLEIADECLLIHSYPIKPNRWPTSGYYQEMGTIAYGLANHEMEHYFGAASTVLKTIFGHRLSYKF